MTAFLPATPPPPLLFGGGFTPSATVASSGGGGTGPSARLLLRTSPAAPIAGQPLQASVIVLEDSSVISAEDHGDRFAVEWSVEVPTSTTTFPPTPSTVITCACPFCPRKHGGAADGGGGGDTGAISVKSGGAWGANPSAPAATPTTTRWLACHTCVAHRLHATPPSSTGTTPTPATADLGVIAYYCSAQCMSRHLPDHARARHGSSSGGTESGGGGDDPVLCDAVTAALAARCVGKGWTSGTPPAEPLTRGSRWVMGIDEEHPDFRITTPASAFDDAPGSGGWKRVAPSSATRLTFIPSPEHEGRAVQLVVRYRGIHQQVVNLPPVMVPPAYHLHHHRHWALPAAIDAALPPRFDRLPSHSLHAAMVACPPARHLLGRALAALPYETRGPGATPPPPNTLRLLSFNILADMYCTPANYPYTPTWALAWSYRYPRILASIAAQSPHVVCLQEVQRDVYHDQLLPDMTRLGYSGMWLPKTRAGVGETGIVDGVATFVATAAATVARVSRLEFNVLARMKAARVGGVPLDASSPAALSSWASTLAATAPAAATMLKRLSKDNVALLTLLELKLPSASLSHVLVVNTHLTWDPAFADVKLWQSLELLGAVQEFRAHFAQEQRTPGTPPLPVVFAGDFNSEPSSAVYSVMAGYGHQVVRAAAGGTIPPASTASQVSSLLQFVRPVPAVSDADLPDDPCGVLPAASDMVHNLPLASAYATVTSEEAPYTNHTQTYSGCIDYVWVSLDSLCPAGAWAIPSKDALYPPAMAGSHPSTHVSSPRAGGSGAGATGSSAGGALLARAGSLGEAAVPAGMSPGPATAEHAIHAASISMDIWGSGSTSHAYGDFTKLPSVYHPSDHLPLLFDIILGCSALSVTAWPPSAVMPATTTSPPTSITTSPAPPPPPPQPPLPGASGHSGPAGGGGMRPGVMGGGAPFSLPASAMGPGGMPRFSRG